MELGRPMVMALNMMDEVKANGTFIDVSKLEDELGVPVVPISASKRDGIEELVERAKNWQKAASSQKLDFCKGKSIAQYILSHI